MKIDIIALAVVAVALAAAATGCSWLLNTYAPDLSPARLFLEADIIAKLAMLLLMLLTLPILVLGVFGVAVRSAARSMAMILRIAALAAGVLGLLAGAYGWLNIQTAIARVGPVSIEVTAPSWAEVLLVVAYSMLVAGFALLFAVGAGLRAGTRRKV
ncbi:hypothetical protein [Brevundimonas sp.]|uniref:hypothetical protein n=1 Tax=Brevundimonas sp. TaxID=1871086 RepID=UPI002D42412C|nr:hypothetical protein [Brevundimonas sp.]HYC73373.1 hypothetical protein [Brevundimonas sp.]